MHHTPATSAPRPISVEHDGEGLRLALREMLEEGFQQGKIERLGEAMDRKRRDAQVDALPLKRTLSPGYYRFAQHLLVLDAERQAGIPLDPNSLAAFEAAGLRTLSAARSEYRYRHPTCSACGAEQDTRFNPQCIACGAKFGRKGGK